MKKESHICAEKCKGKDQKIKICQNQMNKEVNIQCDDKEGRKVIQNTQMNAT